MGWLLVSVLMILFSPMVGLYAGDSWIFIVYLTVSVLSMILYAKVAIINALNDNKEDKNNSPQE